MTNRNNGPVALRALLLVLLLALLAQGSALQAHLHLAHPDRAAIGARVDPGPAGGQGEDGAAAACRLCQEAALSGAYLVPPPHVLAHPPARAFAPRTAPLATFAVSAEPPAWRSRAPPR